MYNPMDLTGKRILVTGASSGIGRACSILFSELGASVVLTARRADALDETFRRMEKKESHLIFPCDICNADEVQELVKATGKIDGLVHAAGVGPMCPIGFVDEAQVASVMKPNYFAFLELMKHYSKVKNRGERLSVVAVASIASLVGWGGVSVYSGSKGALVASVRALAMELAPKGVRVNAISPGHIKTPMLDASQEDALAARQPLGLGVPEDVAHAAAFLLSDGARLITGINMPVDGGYTVQ